MVGESNVSLKENILKKPVEYVKSWVEWATDNHTQIIESCTAVSAQTSIYVVPANNTLYLTGFAIQNCFDGDAGSGINASLYINNNKILLPTAIDLGTASNTTNSLSLPMPIKVESGQDIRVSSGTHNNVSAVIIGFLVPKKISG